MNRITVIVCFAQRLNRLMVGRELRMEELSRENGRLKERVKDLEGSSG